MKQNRTEQGTRATYRVTLLLATPALIAGLLSVSGRACHPLALLCPFHAPEPRSDCQGGGPSGAGAKMLMWLLMKAGISGDFFHSFAYFRFLIFYLEHIVPSSKGGKPLK